jgi:hypothetical protein
MLAEKETTMAVTVRTGERVRQPGVYSSSCCSYEDGLAMDQEAPVCGNCSRATEWIAATPGDPRAATRA